jgi:hypothetical protein
VDTHQYGGECYTKLHYSRYAPMGIIIGFMTSTVFAELMSIAVVGMEASMISRQRKSAV